MSQPKPETLIPPVAGHEVHGGLDSMRGSSSRAETISDEMFATAEADGGNETPHAGYETPPPREVEHGELHAREEELDLYGRLLMEAPPKKHHGDPDGPPSSPSPPKRLRPGEIDEIFRSTCG